MENKNSNSIKNNNSDSELFQIIIKDLAIIQQFINLKQRELEVISSFILISSITIF